MSPPQSTVNESSCFTSLFKSTSSDEVTKNQTSRRQQEPASPPQQLSPPASHTENGMTDVLRLSDGEAGEAGEAETDQQCGL